MSLPRVATSSHDGWGDLHLSAALFYRTGSGPRPLRRPARDLPARTGSSGASVGTDPAGLAAGLAAFLADTCKGSPIAPGDLGLPHRDA